MAVAVERSKAAATSQCSEMRNESRAEDEKGRDSQLRNPVLFVS